MGFSPEIFNSETLAIVSDIATFQQIQEDNNMLRQ